jgi:hypothetical protein
MTEEDHEKYESNNFKIAATAVVSVLLGAAFILALIQFGMNVQQDIDTRTAEKKEAEKIVSIMSVDYSTADFAYTVPDADTDNYLVSSIKEDAKDNYLVVTSKDTLDSIINTIRKSSGDESISYSVDDKFFESGAIIVVTGEGADLASLKVNSVSRDEDYNIQIDVKKEMNPTETEDSPVRGFASFVKIRNIQPNDVKVNQIMDPDL